RLDYFLTLPKGKRMESIDELLGINRLDAARKGIGSMIARMRDRAAECVENARRYMEDRDVREMGQVEGEISSLERELEEVRRRLDGIQPELDLLSRRMSELTALEREMREAERAVGELHGRIESLTHQMRSMEEKLGPAGLLGLDEIEERERSAGERYRLAVGQVEELNTRLTAGLSRLSQLEAERSMLTKSLGELRSKLTKRKEELEELRRLSPDGIRAEMERLMSLVQRTEAELAEGRARAELIERSLEELRGAGAICPVCESPLEERRKRELMVIREKELEGLGGRVARAEGELRKLRENIERRQRDLEVCALMTKEVGEIPHLEREVEVLSSRLGEVEKERAGLSREVEGLKSAIQRSRAEADALNAELSEARRILLFRREHERMAGERKKLMEEWRKASERFEGLRARHDEGEMAEVRRKWEELFAAQRGLQVELSGREGILREKRRILEGAREKVRMAKEHELRANHLERAVEALSCVQAAMSRTQASLRRMFVDGVNDVMGDLWESIYPYGDFVGIQLSVTGEGKTGDYVLMLRDRNGNWIPVEGMVSGGERTDACLALRIAFSIVLAPSLKWIVFDEPTHNLDQDAIQELAKVLRERMPDVVRQVLLITHEERLESAVSGYLYRFHRNKDADEPTGVEQVTAPSLTG
ncbi:MAG: SMC family ATPase, partial [Candidatus Hadarchaeales archaeon]